MWFQITAYPYAHRVGIWVEIDFKSLSFLRLFKNMNSPFATSALRGKFYQPLNSDRLRPNRRNAATNGQRKCPQCGEDIVWKAIAPSVVERSSATDSFNRASFAIEQSLPGY